MVAHGLSETLCFASVVLCADPDKGYWIAHNIMYDGGKTLPNGSSGAGLFNCPACATIRASCTKSTGNPKANCGGLESTVYSEAICRSGFGGSEMEPEPEPLGGSE